MFIVKVIICILLLVKPMTINASNRDISNQVTKSSQDYFFILTDNKVALRTSVNCIKAPCNTINIEEVTKEDSGLEDYSSHLNLYYNISKIFYLKFKYAIDCVANKCHIFLLSNFHLQNEINKALEKYYTTSNNITLNKLSLSEEHALLFKNLISSKRPAIKKAIILDIEEKKLYFSVIKNEIVTILVKDQNILENIYLRLKKSSLDLKALAFQTIFKISRQVIDDIGLEKVKKLPAFKSFGLNKEIAIVIRNEQINKYLAKEFANNNLQRSIVINKITSEFMQLSKLAADEKIADDKLKEISCLLYIYSIMKFFEVEVINLYSNQDLLMVLKA